MFSTRHEVRRLEEIVVELRAALDDGWRRREELMREVERQNAEIAELRAAAIETPSVLAVERDTARRQLEDLIVAKGEVVERLETARGDLETVLDRLRGASVDPVAGTGANGRLHAPGPTLDHVFASRFVLEAERVYDFVAISQLERALSAVPQVLDVHVRRVEGSRAVIDVELDEPGPLLRWLDGALPADADVGDVDSEHLVLSLRTAAGR